MRKRPYALIKWVIPTLFLLLGVLFQNIIHGHGFLGFISFCLAGIHTIYFLLRLLRDRHLTLAKVLRTIFAGILCVGLAVCAVTEVVILRASLGQPEADCPYIVVLGAKVNGTEPSLSLSDRIDAAYDYLTQHPDSIAVLSGGQGTDEDITEAQCMYNYLTARGIPAQRLWLEEMATSTWENLKFSLDIIEANTGTRPTSIGLLSSEYHLFRASLFARECGVEAIGIPAETSWLSLKLNYFTREVAGVWHYILLGGQYHD